MKKKRKNPCDSIQIFLLTGLTILCFSVLSADSMMQRIEKIGREEAAKIIIDTQILELWERADQRKGLRVHQLRETLAEGTRVQSAFMPEGKDVPVIVCENPCWLFFIDEDPLAHFAHPVRIIVLDSKTGRQKMIKAEWWPMIDGKPIFSKVKERTDPKTIIFNKAPEFELITQEQKEILGGSSRRVKTHDPCDSWAVIVCGYDDLPDTFDEDTNGIYNVLIGLGIPDNHILYISPHTTDAGVDRDTSIANVQWAINQVAAQSDETDKVLFFYSSHGGIDSLNCMPGSAGGGNIAAANLDNWLDAITCDELTVIIEACHSGSLIGMYADGTYNTAEDDLVGDGETNRAIFTSASTDTSSYPDVDGTADPNPGDSGSETVWGYVEAFGTAAADLNSDGDISFLEGWQYAWDNDVTRINGWNTPQMTQTGLNANNVYNYCYRIGGDGDLFVADGPGDVGNNSYDYDSTDIWITQDPLETDHQDVVSGMNNYVHVAVHNRGTTDIANGSLKVYWGNVSTATSWPSDFQQIGTTDSFSSLASGDTHTHTWTWYVDPSIGLGHNFCLVTVTDSPGDPMTGGPSGVTYVAPYDNNIAQKNITIIEDPGHGIGTAKFLLKNNTADLNTVDLIVEWIGKPWGSATIVLPEDLFKFISDETIKLDNFKIAKIKDKKLPGLLVVGKTKARLKDIPLKPGDSRVISLDMQTLKTKPGQRSEIRLSQEAKGMCLGAITVRIQQVRPRDCSWVTKISVEAFSDLAMKYKIGMAKNVSDLFARAFSTGACCNKKELLNVLSKALSLEKEIAMHLPQNIPEEVTMELADRLKELEENIKARKIDAALLAQGRIAEMIKKM